MSVNCPKACRIHLAFGPDRHRKIAGPAGSATSLVAALRALAFMAVVGNPFSPEERDPDIAAPADAG